MKIVVYYESPEEQAVAERIVPDVEAIARFTSDAVWHDAASRMDKPGDRPDVSVTAAPDYANFPARSIGGYTIADLNAIRSAPNPILPYQPIQFPDLPPVLDDIYNNFVGGMSGAAKSLEGFGEAVSNLAASIGVPQQNPKQDADHRPMVVQFADDEL